MPFEEPSEHDSDNVIRICMHDYNLCKHDESFYERWIQQDGTHVIRAANLEVPSNIYVHFWPELFYKIPYNVAGVLTPDATGNYEADSVYNDELTFVDSERDFFIWWDGIDSWIINEQVGHTDLPYWKRTDPSITGDYAPQAEAIGIATVTIVPP
ncbi:hypothetical protein ES703_26307 [subsurface metagenome]